MNAPRKSAVPALSAVAVIATLGGCASAETKLWSYDEGTEVEQGLRQHEAIVARVGIYPNEDLSRYVAAVGGRLAAASDRPGLKWQFTVLDSPRPRAFATRGGYVYITRGMLALLRSESDLAAVLAHEISHISTRDALRAEIRANVADAGSLTLAVVFPFETFLVGPYARGSAGLRATMHNSAEEFEADRRGAENLHRAEYPAGSMSAVMEIFEGIEAHDYEHDRPPPGPHEIRRFGIYADNLMQADYVLPRTTRKVAGMEAFNRDYGRRSTDARYRCFAFTPDPETRRYVLSKKESWTHAAADPAFLARLDGLEVGPGRQPEIPTPGGKTSAPQLRDDEARRKPIVLRIRKVQEGDTFASLANTARVPNAEAVLRLLNQRYPRGEPEPGALVKVIE
jgi:Zn-dependent protease with chaperone function